jgi:hypothetical protein
LGCVGEHPGFDHIIGRASRRRRLPHAASGGERYDVSAEISAAPKASSSGTLAGPAGYWGS